MQAKEGMRGGEGLISAVSADGVATKPYFYRNPTWGGVLGFFPLAKADGDWVCWGQQGAGRDCPVATLGAATALAPCVLPPPAAGAALSLPMQAAGSWGLPGELTCCSAPPRVLGTVLGLSSREKRLPPLPGACCKAWRSCLGAQSPCPQFAAAHPCLLAAPPCC